MTANNHVICLETDLPAGSQRSAVWQAELGSGEIPEISAALGDGHKLRGAVATPDFAAQRRRRLAVGASPRGARSKSREPRSGDVDVEIAVDSRPCRRTDVAASRLGRCLAVIRGFHPRLSAAAAARPMTNNNSRP